MTKAEIQLVRSLADKRSRTEHGLFVAEGHKFIGELCTSALRVRKIFALEGLFEGGEVETVSSREMERLSLLKTPSDSLALVEIPHHPFRPDTAQRELVLALDQVQNPGNLGTIIRLADWFGIPEIVCSPTTADCYNPKVVQATMGAILRVKVHYTALEPYLAQARERNIPVYGTFLEGENIYSTPLTPGEHISENRQLTAEKERQRYGGPEYLSEFLPPPSAPFLSRAHIPPFLKNAPHRPATEYTLLFPSD